MQQNKGRLEGKDIVFVGGILKNGGVARRISVLSRQIAEQGANVSFVLLGGIDKDVFFDFHPNVKLVSFKEFNLSAPSYLRDKKKQDIKIKALKYAEHILKRINLKASGKCAFKKKYMRSSSGLRSFLLDHKGCVIIPFGIEAYLKSYFASRGLNCKLIYAEKIAPQMENGNPDTMEIRKEYVGKSDLAVFQTSEERDFFNKCVKERTVVIPNPVSGNLPSRWNGERRHEVVNFCRIAEQKNLPLLINAFVKILPKYKDYKLLIYGNTVLPQESVLRDELIEYIKQTGYEDSIFILPPRADIHEAVKASAMFVCSSDFEGLSNSMLEALAIGMPCICTDCLGGGARDCIKNGENGLLVPMKDEDALADAMAYFIDNPEFAEKCAKEAEKAKTEYSAETIGNRWIDAIEKVV